MNEYVRDRLWEEFKQSVTDMDVARSMIEQGEESETFEEHMELMFDEYCQCRD